MASLHSFYTDRIPSSTYILPQLYKMLPYHPYHRFTAVPYTVPYRRAVLARILWYGYGSLIMGQNAAFWVSPV